jgi:hypothetical protein
MKNPKPQTLNFKSGFSQEKSCCCARSAMTRHPRPEVHCQCGAPDSLRSGGVHRQLSAVLPGRYLSHPARGRSFHSLALSSGRRGVERSSTTSISGGDLSRRQLIVRRKLRFLGWGRPVAVRRAVPCGAAAVADLPSLPSHPSPLLPGSKFQINFPGHPTVPL